MIKKSLLVLIVLSLLLSVVSAISIDVRNPIAEGSQWSFSVDFGSLSSVDEGKIYVDSELALTVFEHSGEVFTVDVSSKVLSHNVNGGVVVLSYNGLNEGDHTISAKTMVSGSVNDEQSVVITFNRPPTKSEMTSLENQIGSLESTVTTLNSTTSTLKSEVSVLEETIIDKDVEINALKQKNSELINEINKIGLDIDKLESSGATNEEVLSNVKDDLNVLLSERDEARKNPITGFFNAGTSSPVLLLALVAIIAIIVIGVFIKKNSSSIYSSSIFSKNDEIEIPNEKVRKFETKVIDKGDEIVVPRRAEESKFKGFFSKFKKEEGVVDANPKRKWATESYDPKSEEKAKQESKRFELGDLIKK